MPIASSTWLGWRNRWRRRCRCWQPHRPDPVQSTFLRRRRRRSENWHDCPADDARTCQRGTIHFFQHAADQPIAQCDQARCLPSLALLPPVPAPWPYPRSAGCSQCRHDVRLHGCRPSVGEEGVAAAQIEKANALWGHKTCGRPRLNASTCSAVTSRAVCRRPALRRCETAHPTAGRARPIPPPVGSAPTSLLAYMTLTIATSAPEPPGRQPGLPRRRRRRRPPAARSAQSRNGRAVPRRVCSTALCSTGVVMMRLAPVCGTPRRGNTAQGRCYRSPCRRS